MSWSNVAPANKHFEKRKFSPRSRRSTRNRCAQRGPYMKPAPPVIMIFFTPGNGSNLVLPVRIGAFFQTPKSSKKLPLSPFFSVAANINHQKSVFAVLLPVLSAAVLKLTGGVPRVG